MTRKKRLVEHWMIIAFLLMVYDVATIAISYFAALLIRFDFRFNQIGGAYIEIYKETIIPYIVFCVVIYWFFRTYRSIWRFASYSELVRIIGSVTLCAVVYFIYLRVFV